MESGARNDREKADELTRLLAERVADATEDEAYGHSGDEAAGRRPPRFRGAATACFAKAAELVEEAEDGRSS
eukprot:4692774-Alexandrium_andersonii.AAC.1